MKDRKRIAALLAAILLLLAFCLPMVFAFGEREEREGWFLAAFGIAFLVPVLAYAISLSWKVFNRKKTVEPEGTMKNIIFDVGNVLVDFSWETYLKGFGFSKEKYEKIADAVFRSEVWNQRDQGLFEEADYVQKFVDAAPEYEADIREVMRRSPESIRLKDYAVTWVKYLKEKGYRLYVLSNYSNYMLDQNRSQMAFLEYMDGVIFSCEVKQIKPNSDIFETLLKRYDLKAEECVFIDDNGANCQAAEKLGIHAVQFKSLPQAAEELKKLGIE